MWFSVGVDIFHGGFHLMVDPEDGSSMFLAADISTECQPAKNRTVGCEAM